ncbi:S1C family serine protease [Acidiferrimicrobium sp. IK]|nr:S1C family serine protease [Acidiferrimicrobium sp. IK]
MARTWTIALLAGVIGALVASGVGVVVGNFESRTTTVVAPEVRAMTPNTLASVPLASAPGWATLVDAVSYSVASVSVDADGGPRVGSGVVYEVAGDRTYLLTDAGLVDEPGTISVTFNGSTPVRASLVNRDDKTGLAVLWVYGSSHSAPDVGTVGQVHEADQVMAIGARASYMAAAVPGSVSSLDRTVADPTTSVSLSGLLALSASVPQADAGGAVVDDKGQVVAIATSATSSNPQDDGLSFAVPIDVAQHVAAQMLAAKPVTHPWLGVVESADLDSASASRMGVSGGAELISIAPGSPLARAHLRAQDVVTSFDGQLVTSSGELTALLNRCEPGAVATVGYREGTKSGTASVRIAEQPADIGSP